ncbi:MAG: beta-ketoacyl-[acyl-carrier-protein] synthase II, partial [Deltaproteobacteria bacterium]
MRRVVVTGLGITSPLGTGIEKNWDAMMHGRSGIGPITRFDSTDLPVKIAGEITDFPAEEFFDRKEARKMDLFIHYALGAAAMALADSGLEINDDNAERVGVVVGSGMGGLPAIEKYQEAMSKGGYRKVSPFFIPMTIINLAGGQISIKCGAKGPNIAPVSACATGTHSIGDAYRMIQRSDADAVIAGGTEATICPLAMG